MATMKFGDRINFSNTQIRWVSKIQEVVPIKYDTIGEAWVVVAQQDATHMLIVIEEELGNTEYIMFEIGKCDNIYLLADAIVD